jgi:UDP-N-acetylglucosamine 2-epimerase (non-hydrolysing)
MDTAARVLAVMGTRPEAIKLAPVIRQLRRLPALEVRVAASGQHRTMLDQVLKDFDISRDYDLNVMAPDQTLPALTSRLLLALDPLYEEVAPSVVIVQGDTTTALVGALAAHYRKIPCAHVEAGLRTNDRYVPFPEEMNRRLIGSLATWHFAPTQSARLALEREGIAAGDILVTGNTVIDALHFVLDRPAPEMGEINIGNRRMLLVTAHRRESFGAPFEALCRAIRRLADLYEDLFVCYPLHLNPNVRAPVARYLSNHLRNALIEPLDYLTLSHLLSRAYIVLTDSGGLQEEAPALGKPVLVMRDVTERPDAVTVGVAELIGTNEDHIVARVSRLLDSGAAYAAMARSVSPYGDGHASERIASFLASRLKGSQEQMRDWGYELAAP